jgi:carboxylesterase
LIGLVWRFFPKGDPDWYDIELHKDHLEYPAYPIRVATELHGLLDEMQKVLPQIQVPVLIVHSKNDASVPHQDAELIHSKIGSEDKELLWLEKSGHNVTRDSDRGQVFRASSEFIRKVSNNGSD